MTNFLFSCRQLLCCSLLLISFYSVHGQACDYVAAYPDWTSYCPDAVPVCNLDYLNISTCTPPVSVEDDQCEPTVICNGSGAIHNTSWFAFYASTENLQITVTLGSCITPDIGVQIGIYDDCPCNGGNCIAGYDNQINNTRTVSVFSLEPTKIYYIVIDGWAAAECNYTLSFDFSIYFSWEDYLECKELELSACQDVFSGNQNNEFTLDANGSLGLRIDIANSYRAQLYDVSVHSSTGANLPVPSSFQMQELNWGARKFIDIVDAGAYTICIDAISNFCNDASVAICDFPICEEFTVKDCPDEYFFTTEDVCFSDMYTLGYNPRDLDNNYPWLGNTLQVDDFDENWCARSYGLDCQCDVAFTVCPNILGNIDPEIYDIYLEEGEEYCYDLKHCFGLGDEPFNAFHWGQGYDGCDGLYYEGRLHLMELALSVDTINNYCESFEIQLDIKRQSPIDLEPDSIRFIWLDDKRDTVATGLHHTLELDENYTLIYSMVVPNQYDFEEDFDLVDSLQFDFTNYCSSCIIDTLIIADASYSDLDELVHDQYGSNIENCTSIQILIDYDFSLPWEGSDNMESCDEFCASNAPCDCDTNASTQSGCENCWDFMSFDINIDGLQYDTEIIGDAGTGDDEQTGRFEKSYCVGQGQSYIDVTIGNQNWEPEEINNYELLVICFDHQIAPLEDQTVCQEAELNLIGGFTNPACATYEWISRDGSKIEAPNQLKTIAYELIDQDVFTLIVTDSLGCNYQQQFTVSLKDCTECYCAQILDPDAGCTTLYDPVCGCNGITYSNACTAEKEYGVVSWTIGACNATGTDTISAVADLAECDVVLSQDLFSFGCSRIKENVRLNWEATNINQFEILRSQNGIDFEKIDQIEAEYPNQIQQYLYYDINPFDGDNYYQLRLLQKDKISSSNIKHIYFDDQVLTAKIYPQPAASILYFEHPDLSPGSISLYNLEGQELILTIQYDGTKATINGLKNLMTGIYILVFENGDNQEAYRIIKL